ncbi:transposase [Elysia marginata]|uniref:Transposase n=1 Tax=Elysia marginata TaxID=1093978 RepID=A0AAV4JL95_9GAST|nr:transposase [Elysia marginata]
MLTLPPHPSHKLQPLDRTVFGPFKTYFNSKAQNWMREHPGQVMSIYDLPGIVKEAIPLAMTAHNGIKGFSATGIFPLNPDVFTDIDFLPSMVTDQPDPVSGAGSPSGSGSTTAGPSTAAEGAPSVTITVVRPSTATTAVAPLATASTAAGTSTTTTAAGSATTTTAAGPSTTTAAAGTSTTTATSGSATITAAAGPSAAEVDKFTPATQSKTTVQI